MGIAIKPIGPRPRDEHVFADQVEGERSVDGVAEWVEHGCRVVVDVGGYRVDVECRYGQVLREPAVALHPDSDRVAAQMAPPGPAVSAMATCDVAFGGGPVADRDAGHPLADRRHGPHEFVTDREWSGHRGCRPVVPIVDVEVGAADRHSTDSDEYIVRSDGGGWNLFEFEPGRGSRLDESLHHEITSNSRPTSMNASIALSSCSVVWAAFI